MKILCQKCRLWYKYRINIIVYNIKEFKKLRVQYSISIKLRASTFLKQFSATGSQVDDEMENNRYTAGHKRNNTTV